ncbi:ferritin-like protein [Neorhizobium sp. T7_12]|uniref:ferritin-like domain-containing protein n=1 Tax=Neorhizobium sp. T7_12 TaxID=2093832 RepID=UPI000CF99C5B|nr:ferritin-like protein [Neorhizobium sp. T7_12]
MLLIQTAYVDKINAAGTGDELIQLVQGAAQLEFATIPPYLTAMLSLKPGTNREIWQILHSVVIEEMLHMTINCNLISALGGGAKIDDPSFVPRYPTHLPMAVNSGLEVPLQAYSVTAVRDVFMKIEAPETPLVFPFDAGPKPYATIGQFYRALADKIKELGKSIFVGDPSRQLDAPTWFGDRLTPMRKPDDAIAAIEALVEEGEGTSTSPLDEEEEIAHYYRFEQLLHGRLLVPDKTVPQGFAFTGEPIPFDAAGVYPLLPNQRLDALPPDSQVYRVASQFAFVFTKLLKSLHQTFNGTPGAFDSAMGLMFELRLVGQKLCSLPAGDGVHHAGPVFEYVTQAG